ncbi:MAG: NAD(P)-dependent oxidoreductase, partial [Novosphingobium sp.]|nr:NAD(P)-dependent oxidoreductase [Novosphingobium sp.]
VWASSETILGLPFAEPPRFAPIDETHPLLPNWSYALGKRLGETMAEEFARWHPAMGIVSLRFSNVYMPEDYAALPQIQADPASRKWNLWSYIDAEDAAQACRGALEAATTGHEAMIIAAADNLMGRPSRDLMAEHFPGVPLAEALAGEAALLSSARAEELIGFQPRVSWRDRT